MSSGNGSGRHVDSSKPCATRPGIAADRPLFNVPVALSVMVFFALCAQCVATLAVIRRETNSWRWPLFTFTYMTTLAYAGAFITYQLGLGWPMVIDWQDLAALIMVAAAAAWLARGIWRWLWRRLPGCPSCTGWRITARRSCETHRDPAGREELSVHPQGRRGLHHGMFLRHLRRDHRVGRDLRAADVGLNAKGLGHVALVAAGGEGHRDKVDFLGGTVFLLGELQALVVGRNAQDPRTACSP